MKFACESCSARYYLDDARVSGRVLRIRCKACGSVMTVRGTDAPAAEAPSATPEAGFSRRATAAYNAVAPAAPLDPAEAWYYASDGQSYGPYREAEICDRLRDQRIPADAYVWKQSFGDWQPAASVEPFASVIAPPARRSGSNATIQLSAADLAPLQQPAPHAAIDPIAAIEREAREAAREAAERAAAEEREAAAAEQREAAERAEREAREAAERAEREAREAAERAEREAREAAERAEREAREAAEREARERAESEAAADAEAAAARAAALREALAARRPPPRPDRAGEPARPRAMPMPGSGAFPSVGSRGTPLGVQPVPPPRPTPIAAVPSPQRSLRDMLAELSGDSPTTAVSKAHESSESLDENQVVADAIVDQPADAQVSTEPPSDANHVGAPPQTGLDEATTADHNSIADVPVTSDEPGTTPAEAAEAATAADQPVLELELDAVTPSPRRMETEPDATRAGATTAAAPPEAGSRHDHLAQPAPDAKPAPATPAVTSTERPAAPAAVTASAGASTARGAETGTNDAVTQPRRSAVVYVIVAAVVIALGLLIALNREKNSPPTTTPTMTSADAPAAAPTTAERVPSAADQLRDRQNRNAALSRSLDRLGRALTEARTRATPPTDTVDAGAALPSSPSTTAPNPERRGPAVEPAPTPSEAAPTTQIQGTQGLYGRLANERVAGPGTTTTTTTAVPEATGPSQEHFAEGLRGFVQDSVTRCNQRQLGEEGPLSEARISLELTVQPSGRVSSVSTSREIEGTAFERCLQTHRERWLFDRFEGEAVTLQKVYVLQ